jgi:hypothetical protein
MNWFRSCLYLLICFISSQHNGLRLLLKLTYY